ncbi:hypothetical protein [Silvimonas amylolytica]|uniref:Uncharacterized protein n=1 Tax=Silvimonas amylolytica TaxID=449663 RepID=A0ABQ2PKX2_9NEIS|nr:hypothetical protein [Silvimonas amylolytica]GGP26020.1 hypothetical protein GCM10010971_18390 [Silvimonas amylolytica]
MVTAIWRAYASQAAHTGTGDPGSTDSLTGADPGSRDANTCGSAINRTPSQYTTGRRARIENRDHPGYAREQAKRT